MLATNPVPHVAATPFHSAPCFPSIFELASPSVYGLRLSNETYGARIAFVHGVQRIEEVMLVERRRKGIPLEENVVPFGMMPVVASAADAEVVLDATAADEVELSTAARVELVAARRRSRRAGAATALKKSIAGSAATPMYDAMLNDDAARTWCETVELTTETVEFATVAFAAAGTASAMRPVAVARAAALERASEVAFAAEALGTLPATMSLRQKSPETSLVQMAVRNGPRR